MAVSQPKSEQKLGFLAISGGGIGNEALHVVKAAHTADQRPFALKTIRLDTEPHGDDGFDYAIHLDLTADRLSTIKANPAKFGAGAATIVEKYSELLNIEDVRNGARTIRLLTQLIFYLYYSRIARTIRSAIHELKKNALIDAIVPVMMASAGGGTGSALLPLLSYAFLDKKFYNFVAQALPTGTLLRPILFTSDPWAYAHAHELPHAHRILGNGFAFRLETVRLEQLGAVKWIFHTGFSNKSGTVLADPTHISNVLGTAAYELMHQWPYIKSSTVDGSDTAGLRHGYTGLDLPENLFPELLDDRSDATEAPTSPNDQNAQNDDDDFFTGIAGVAS